MARTQTLKYKVEVGGRDLTDYVASINTSARINSLPTATITLKDPDCWLSKTYDLDGRIPAKVWGSVDGTAPSTLIFNGVVNRSNPITSANGANSISLYCNGGGSLSASLVGPNQVVYEGVEVPQIFTGTDTAGWTAVNGIYPNGLLYKTGYTLVNHAGDIIADEVDLPTAIVLNGLTLFSAMTRVCDIYGLVFWISDGEKKVHIARTPLYGDETTNFVATDPATVFTYGVDINAEDISREGSMEYDKVTVVGASDALFYTVGEGAKELRIVDTDLVSAGAVIAKALQTYGTWSGDTRSMRLTVPAHPADLVGRSVTIVDGRRSLSLYKNVVGQSHSISGDRWTTALELETTRKTEGKILAEILDELNNNKKERISGAAYLKGEGGINSAKSEYTNVCAVGFGTSADDGADHMMGQTIMKTVSDVVVQPDGKQYFFSDVMPGEMGGNIKEIALFANAGKDPLFPDREIPGNLPAMRQYQLFNHEPTNPIVTINGAKYQYLRDISGTVGADVPTYPLDVVDANGNIDGGDFYYCSLRGDDARVVTYGRRFNKASDVTSFSIPVLSDLDKRNVSGDDEVLIEWNSKKGMGDISLSPCSKDAAKVISPFAAISTSPITDPEGKLGMNFVTCTYLEFDTGVRYGAVKALTDLTLTLRAKARYTKAAGDVTDLSFTNVGYDLYAYYDSPNIGWVKVRSSLVCDTTWSDELPYPDEGYELPITGDGKIVFCIVQKSTYTDVASSDVFRFLHEIRYAGLAYGMYMGNAWAVDIRTMKEVVRFDKTTKSFHLSHAPYGDSLKMWPFYKEDDNGVLKPRRDPSFSQWPERDINYVIKSINGKDVAIYTYDEMSAMWKNKEPPIWYEPKWERYYHLIYPYYPNDPGGEVLMEYSYLNGVLDSTIPESTYRFPGSNYIITTGGGEDPYRSGKLYVRCGAKGSVPKSMIVVNARCVCGPMVARFRVGQDDRIDQGIEMDGMKSVYFVAALDTKDVSGDGVGYIGGSGCEKPVL